MRLSEIELGVDGENDPRWRGPNDPYRIEFQLKSKGVSIQVLRKLKWETVLNWFDPSDRNATYRFCFSGWIPTEPLPEIIDTASVYDHARSTNSYLIEHVNSLQGFKNAVEEQPSITLNQCEQLTMLDGLPEELDVLTIWTCPKLKDIRSVRTVFNFIMPIEGYFPTEAENLLFQVLDLHIVNKPIFRHRDDSKHQALVKIFDEWKEDKNPRRRIEFMRRIREVVRR
jgi:hypothetical protein